MLGFDEAAGSTAGDSIVIRLQRSRIIAIGALTPDSSGPQVWIRESIAAAQTVSA